VRPLTRLTQENIYLIVGVRGGFEPRAPRTARSVEVALGQTLERWGISNLPWGPCDSGADLESPGDQVSRGWTHVDLRPAGGASAPDDVPVSALLRSTWDALELYGAIALSGVDAIVPMADAGRAMWRRVAGSVVRDPDRASGSPASVLVEAGPRHREDWDRSLVLGELSELAMVDQSAAAGDEPPEALAAAPHPFPSRSTYPLRVRVELPAWTIDDAAWLAEAVSVAWRRAGVTDAIGLAITRLES
jgi:hypothetical protein